jgi:plastocyanin
LAVFSVVTVAGVVPVIAGESVQLVKAEKEGKVMNKALRLALVTALSISLLSCTNPGQSNEAPAAKATASPSTQASASPATATPTPAPTAPMTATVRALIPLKWKDDASGTSVTTIKVGGTVTWTMEQGTHQLKADAPSAQNGCKELDNSFDSEKLGPGKSVSRQFNTVGTFGYHCGIHGGTADCTTPPGTGNMPGVIKVVP